MPSQEDIEAQISLLSVHRRTLAVYLEQRAILGSAYILPAVAHGIIESRTNIRRIKKVLSEWGIQIENLPIDEELIETLQEQQPKPLQTVSDASFREQEQPEELRNPHESIATSAIDDNSSSELLSNITLFMKDKRIFSEVKWVYCDGKEIGAIWVKKPLNFQVEPGKHSISFKEHREGFSFTNMIMTISAAGRHAYETGGRDRSKDYVVDYGPYFIFVRPGSNEIRFIHTREGVRIE